MVISANSSREPSASYIVNRRGARLLVHETPATEDRLAIAIICPPFSEEKQKSYRAHYHLARMLAERGVACYRFDYAGCGDSDGDFIDTTIDSMVDDTCDTIEYIRGMAAADKVYIIGTRLGATIATLAAERQSELAGLGLLFPVINGSRYWADVLRQQQMADLSAGLKPAPRSRLAEHLREHGCVEIESNLVSSAMVQQLSDLNLCETTPRIHCRVFSACLRSDKKNQLELANLLVRFQNLACSTEQFVSDEEEFWTLRAMYGNYLPIATSESVLKWLKQ